MVATLALTPAAARATTWSILPTPAADPPSTEFLTAVSCSSVSQCRAVGGISYERPPGRLAAVWDGTSWSVQSDGGDSDEGNVFYGVSCPARNDCLEAGFDEHQGPIDPTVGLWNGVGMSVDLPVETTPVPPDQSYPSAELHGVACSSPTACTAVGSDDDLHQPLVERWDGLAWTIEPTPTLPGEAQLVGVSCYPGSCVAVGTQQPPTGLAKPLIETWNGSSWAVSATPNLGTSAALVAISCPRVHHCTAVGGRDNPTGPGGRALVEQQVTSAWRVESAPNPADAINSAFNAVKCRRDVGCTAVGLEDDNDGDTRTLIEHQLYVRWNIQPSPDPPGATSSSLSGVACPSAGVCYAVGESSDILLATPTRNVLIEASSPG